MLRDNPLTRASRELLAVARAETRTHRDLRDRLIVVLLVTVVVDLICGALILVFEQGVPRSEVHDYGDALFFTTTQLLSVSSSLANPLTGAARILDVFMELYAITVVASLAGMTGAFFHRRGSERREEEPISAKG